ncbi:mitochondrial ribosomal subunit protein-domain-containing protein [Collybia nuda]|uniref:Mitochondrial ribosomal subunit protein-domain-containing protein n=1 Tax=Collybia nuda TaxID=64659 RepID=A0A9P5Y4M6_9AGAR|nr:mitochondrial ribosomal subunit protein-domain-containing protein [Collybia nuda]
MASLVSILPRISRRKSPALSFLRPFSSSSPALARRVKAEEKLTSDQAFDLLNDEYDDDDSASAGHLMLRQQRQVLYYLRLIEHEMPKLAAYRKTFVPPTNQTPIIVRSLDYAGEDHPVTTKRVMVASVDQLPLRDANAIHKIKLLAGPRWTPKPPADAGVRDFDTWDNGYIKISCEDFPKPAMNLKWASDTLGQLVAEANNPKDMFKDVPIDLRHVYSKTRKAKRGDHLRARAFEGPSLSDFPKEWLPYP